MTKKDKYIRKAGKLERKAEDIEDNYSYLWNIEAKHLRERAKELRRAAETCP